jgi:hypothetical protein
MTRSGEVSRTLLGAARRSGTLGKVIPFLRSLVLRSYGRPQAQMA